VNIISRGKNRDIRRRNVLADRRSERNRVAEEHKTMRLAMTKVDDHLADQLRKGIARDKMGTK
jgi:hypothetical protein